MSTNFPEIPGTIVAKYGITVQRLTEVNDQFEAELNQNRGGLRNLAEVLGEDIESSNNPVLSVLLKSQDVFTIRVNGAAVGLLTLCAEDWDPDDWRMPSSVIGITCHILPSARRKGIAYNSVSCFLEVMMEKYYGKTVETWIDPGNQEGRKLAEKLRFTLSEDDEYGGVTYLAFSKELR